MDLDAKLPSSVEQDQQASDRVLIRELLENWVVWRDAGDWERFRTVWHPDGRMMATWTQGTADEFIAISKAGWARGVSILHFLGGTAIDLAGNRAVSQTKMTISQRAEVEGGHFVRRALAPAASTTSWKSAPANGAPCCASRSTRRIGMDPVSAWHRAGIGPGPAGAVPASAIATSPICRPISASASNRTCRASRGRRWRRFTPGARPGSQASRSDMLAGPRQLSLAHLTVLDAAPRNG